MHRYGLAESGVGRNMAHSCETGDVVADPQVLSNLRWTKLLRGWPPTINGRQHSSFAMARKRRSARVPSFETMDRLGRAVTARLTQGISPHALYAAWFDWASHLANAPGRLIELGVEAVNIGARFARFATHSLSEHAKPPFEPQAGDRRFSDELLEAAPLRAVAAGLPRSGSLVGKRHPRGPRHDAEERRPHLLHHPPIARCVVAVERALAQSSDHERTLRSSGANLARGATNLQEDFWRALAMQPEPIDGLEVGKDLAVTPGEVGVSQRADGAHPVQARD